MERDVEGFRERLLEDPPRHRTWSMGGWTRRWSFFIWTWTIDTEDREWFVETVQHRFLGEEVVHRYSKTRWMAGALACVVTLAITISAYGMVVHLAFANSNISPSFAAMFGLFVLPIVAIDSAILYFTFVPPKEFRSRKSS